MKHKLVTLSLIMSMLLAFAAVPATVMAQAYTTPFITSITYQNLSSSTATINFLFVSENSSTSVSVDTTLPGNAGGSLFGGSVSGLSAGFRGSAIMSSDKPVVATLVQVPQGSATVKNRPLSNGFGVGAPTVLVATTLKNVFNATSILSVQNADSVPADVTVNFYAVGGAAPLHTDVVQNLPAGSAKYYDLGVITQLGATFNGSATITAIDDGGAAGSGSVVATVMELSTNGAGASAFEGVSSGAGTVYMPSALCNAFGGQNSAYAVQNTSTSSSAAVTINYSNGATSNANIGPGNKQSFQTCAATGMTQGFSGSATITATGADVIAIGKVFGLGLSTAFVGANQGVSDIALPYVRWATDTNYNNGTQQRTNLAIQNVGGSPVTDNIVVRYLNKDGVEVGTHTITADLAVGAKVNSNPTNAGLTEFGISGSVFGGSAIVDGPAGSQLVAIARVQTRVVVNGETAAEDYNGMAIVP